MQRELDLFVRENRIRQAAYSANTAERLQHAQQFAEADQRYQAEITEKQQALDEAKQKLENMKDELRKADLPSSWAE